MKKSLKTEENGAERKKQKAGSKKTLPKDTTMANKSNIKTLLTELFQFFVSLPQGRERQELDRIISMINLGNVDLKKILLIINGHIEKEKSTQGSNKTLREKNVQFWMHVMSIFTKHLRS